MNRTKIKREHPNETKLVILFLILLSIFLIYVNIPSKEDEYINVGHKIHLGVKERDLIKKKRIYSDDSGNSRRFQQYDSTLFSYASITISDNVISPKVIAINTTFTGDYKMRINEINEFLAYTNLPKLSVDDFNKEWDLKSGKYRLRHFLTIERRGNPLKDTVVTHLSFSVEK